METESKFSLKGLLLLFLIGGIAVFCVVAALPMMATHKASTQASEDWEVQQMGTAVALEVTATAEAYEWAEQDKTSIDQGLVRDIMEHDERLFDRGMRGVEKVAISGDAAQTATSFSMAGTVCAGAALVLAITGLLYVIDKIKG